MNKELRILLLEDVPSDAELVERELCKGKLSFSLRRVETKKAFVRELEDPMPHLILADYSLPSFDGLSALAIAQKKCPDVLFIFVSGAIGEEMAIETLKKGATDYVLKDHLARLVPVVKRALNEAEERIKRKKAEEELKRSEQEKITIMDSMLEHVVYQDTKNRILWTNRTAGESVSLTPEQLVGHHCYEIWHQRNKPCKGCPIVKACKTGQPQQGEIRTPDGRIWFMQGSPIRGENGNVLGVVEITLDITERKQAEEKIKKLSSAIEQSIDGVAISLIEPGELGPTLTYVNNAFARMHGYFSKEMIGMKVKNLHNKEQMPKFKEGIEQVVTQGRWKGETVHVRKDGTPFPTSISATSFKSEEGKLMMVTVCRDITERKKAEEQIRASLKEKEVLLKEIYHRVKNNLQLISSLLNLEAGYIKDKQILKMFEEYQDRIRSIGLIHEKLSKSKDLARVDFAEYIQSLVAHLYHSYKVNPELVKLKTNIGDVLLNFDMAIPCGLIINELVSNSLQHALPKGMKGKICINLHSNNDKFILIVSNNGIGFPKDLDFRNTETLGLQLVCTLTDQLGGSIELNRNGGTEFKITFEKPR